MEVNTLVQQHGGIGLADLTTWNLPSFRGINKENHLGQLGFLARTLHPAKPKNAGLSRKQSTTDFCSPVRKQGMIAKVDTHL